MSTFLVFLGTFACGAIYECGCTFWVHYVERNQTGFAVGFSMLNALVIVIGVESFLKRKLFAFAYVLGYGVGTLIAVEVIARWWVAR
jgi:uncharacterized protein YebE (UPF0316 family)